MMKYEARKVCNFILAHYDAQEFDLTNLRLNKLLYFIHGCSFKQRGEGLGDGSAHEVWSALSESEAARSGLLEDLEDKIEGRLGLAQSKIL